MAAQRLPNFLYAASSVRSSAGVKVSRLSAGFNWLHHRSLQLCDERSFSPRAMNDQFLGPWASTSAVRRASSCAQISRSRDREGERAMGVGGDEDASLEKDRRRAPRGRRRKNARRWPRPPRFARRGGSWRGRKRMMAQHTRERGATRSRRTAPLASTRP
eukprot:30814-Pelagococcus_subviridis.AAC.5